MSMQRGPRAALSAVICSRACRSVQIPLERARLLKEARVSSAQRELELALVLRELNRVARRRVGPPVRAVRGMKVRVDAGALRERTVDHVFVEAR